MAPEIIVKENKQIAVQGDLTFYTITPLCHQFPKILPTDTDVAVNLSQVQQCDTASLVLLLSMIDFYQAKKLTVKFVNMPDNIKTLVTLYNLKSVIKFS